jgi:hypothetical protein
MTPEEFRRLADTWGGDIARWPASAQAEAHRRAATAEGAAILADAQRLDALLATAPEVTSERSSRAAFAVIQRIAAGGEDRDRYWRAPPWLAHWLVPVASVACSAVIGISLATMVPFGHTEQSTIVLSEILDSGSMTPSWMTR